MKKKPTVHFLKGSKRSIAAKRRWAKYKCYRQAFMNMGCKPMTKEEVKKSRATRPVDLHLTRKDAQHLLHILMYCMGILTDTAAMDFNSTKHDKAFAKKRILNKLKRSGIR